jgi:hypothetical protein
MWIVAREGAEHTVHSGNVRLTLLAKEKLIKGTGQVVIALNVSGG